MFVTALCSSMSNDYGLGKTTQIIFEALSELGTEVRKIELPSRKIPYYDGSKTTQVDDIMNLIKEGIGVIIAATCGFNAPSAALQVFLEYLSVPEYRNIMKNKNCMICAVSKNGGERSAIESISKALNYAGAFDSVRIGLNEELSGKLDSDEDLKLIIEKQTEDFYRIVRQSRKYIITVDSVIAGNGNLEDALRQNFTEKDLKKISDIEKKQKLSVSEVYKTLNLDAFNERQQRDIDEISQFFTQKASSKPEEAPVNIFANDLQKSIYPPEPRVKTLKQLTQNLPRYYQPQLAAGMTAIMQLIITGAENIEGYLKIANTECEYFEGTSAVADITMISDSVVWEDILKGKYSAQKAFMTGKIKVRGNFKLLTRYDQLFTSQS